MWKLPVEIACILILVVAGALSIFFKIRHDFRELGVPSEEFRDSPLKGKLLWVGFAAVVLFAVYLFH
jgi:hypothetical protein